MTIKAVVSSLDGVAEELKSHYRKEGDQFVLDVERVGGWALEDVENLRKVLDTERDARKTLERKLAQYGDVTPEQVRESLAELERLQGIDTNKKAEELAKEQVESVRKALLEEWQGKVEKRDSEIDRLIRDNAARSALAEARGNPKLLMPILMQRIRTVEADGQYRAEVIDDDGRVRHNREGKPMTIAELVAEIKGSDDYAAAFEADRKQGTGFRRQTGVQAPAKVSADPEERVRAMFPDLP